jgi:predicted mannosyl-3-phosphoglycerate phosphatase (HAD superfamily)
MKHPPYPPPRSIFIDVDDTLIIASRPNHSLVEWAKARHRQGYEIVIWSSRGTDHARAAADVCDLAGIAAAVVSKPGYIVDDKGWAWTRYTKRIRRID